VVKTKHGHWSGIGGLSELAWNGIKRNPCTQIFSFKGEIMALP
jgi:hypothetical protein